MPARSLRSRAPRSTATPHHSSPAAARRDGRPTPRRATLGVALAALLAAPAVALAPAYADSTPIPTEPPGGATCAPGALTATCGQDTGTKSGGTKSGGTKSGGTKGGTTKSGTTKSGTTKSGTTGTTSTRTGSGPTVTSLPRTGPADALPYGLAGAALLGVGAALVVGARRPASRR